jgi:hypothetical protein
MAVTPPRIEVQIGALVLDGVAPEDPLVAAALRRALAAHGLEAHADRTVDAITAELEREAA